MFLPLIAVVVLWGIWSIYWYIVFATAQSIYIREVEKLNRQGISFTCESQDWGGYPFRVELSCASPRLAIERQDIHISAGSGSLLAIIQAYNFNHAIALLDGPSTYKEEGGISLTATHDRAIVSLRRLQEQSARLALEVNNLDIDRLGKSASVIANAEINPDQMSRFSAAFGSLIVALPGMNDVVVGDTGLDASVPPILLNSSNPLKKSASTGERIVVERLEIKQGTLTVTGKGELGLDQEGRPVGNISTQTSDLNLLLEKVKLAVNLDEKKIAPLRTILTLLQGGKPSLAADLIARDGSLFWGPLKLADLQPIL